MKRRPVLQVLLATGVGSLAGCVGSLDRTVRQTSQGSTDERFDCFFPEDGVGFHVRNQTDAAKAVSVRIERDDGGVVFDETFELDRLRDDGTGHVRAPEGVFLEPDTYVTRISTGEETATDSRRVATQCDRPAVRITSTEGIRIRYFGRD